MRTFFETLGSVLLWTFKITFKVFFMCILMAIESTDV